MKIPMRVRVVLLAAAVMLLLFLLFPLQTAYMDDGSTVYTSPLYSVTYWCSLDGKRGTEICLLPHFFHRPIYSHIYYVDSIY